MAEVRKSTRWLEVTDCLDFIIGHADTFSTFHGEAQEVTLLSEPLTLMWFEAKLIVAEGVQDLADVLFMLFERSFGEDDDIIKVGMTEDPEVGIEDRVHESLENGRGGGESHGHDSIFIEAVEGFEGGVSFRPGSHAEV